MKEAKELLICFLIPKQHGPIYTQKIGRHDGSLPEAGSRSPMVQSRNSLRALASNFQDRRCERIVTLSKHIFAILEWSILLIAVISQFFAAEYLILDFGSCLVFCK